MRETWKPISGYSDMYQVSNLGRVRAKSGKIIEGFLCREGTRKVKLTSRPYTSKSLYIHHLVAHAFLKAKPLSCVFFKNGNLQDCRPSNLRYSSRCGTDNGRYTHGHKPGGVSSPTLNSWRSMMNRCYNPESRDFHLYGAKGFRVIDRWHIFENFLRDMGERPIGTTIDRKDNFKGYSRSNCRWADQTVQSRNRGCAKLNPTKIKRILRLYRAGEGAAAISRRFGVTPGMIAHIYKGRMWKDITGIKEAAR